MMQETPILHLLCGKIASGKSTLASHPSRAPETILVSEEIWLKALFSDQMTTGADYVRCSNRLQSVMAPHVPALLKVGVSVALDFPANTVARRHCMRGVIDETGIGHQMHLVDVPDDICLARLNDRNAQGAHDVAPSEEQFHRFSKHFVAPTPEEGFNIVRHKDNNRRA